MRPSHPGVEDVEDSALETLFQRGMRMRLYLVPLVLMAAITLGVLYWLALGAAWQET